MFHRPSGKTHLLNAASHDLLTIILRDASDTLSVAAALAELQQEELTDEQLNDVYEMLVRCEFLGLVERSVSQ